ncbi:MAG: sirohydrochlorin chelatase [Rhodoglobus sp.]
MTLLLEAPSRTATAAALVAISHGTSSLEGQEAIAGLVSAVAAARRDLVVAGGFVDVQQPDVRATLDSLDRDRSGVVVPLLLSAGFHVHVDLRKALARTADRSTALSAALGPDDRLVAVLARRLHALDLRADDRLVLACAGSSDSRAVDDCREMGRRLAVEMGRSVQVGFISAAAPRLADAVATERAAAGGSRVIVSTYLMAPGYFADLAAATGADLTTPPLLLPGEPAAPELVELVLDRYLTALNSLPAPEAVS